MEVKYTPIFEDALLITNLSDTIDNNKLHEQCNHVKKTKPSVAFSNVGGYQSPPLFRHTCLCYDQLCLLVDNIQAIIDQYVSQITFDVPKRAEVGNFWLNYNGHRDYNDYHTHPNSVFSGVYYVKAPPGCGEIKFYNNHIVDTLWGYFFTDSSGSEKENHTMLKRIVPEEGMLILFPGYYPHSTAPNMSNDLRLSISFNSALKLL